MNNPPSIDEKEVLRIANHFVTSKIKSLENDAAVCLQNPPPLQPAPFPALLFCFSVIDLLGALYSGDASKNAKTAEQSAKYMRDFMNYTDDQVTLIQRGFRHKLVHLADPCPRLLHNGSTYLWAIFHDERKLHLHDQKQDENSRRFVISIWSLVEDIKKSTECYLERLKSDETLRQKFHAAHQTIFS